MTIEPYYFKVIRFGWGETGKTSNITRYRREETSKIEVSHLQERKGGVMLIWLKSFGMVKWYIETNDVVRAVRKYDLIMTTDVNVIKDTDYVH